jgi:hypothetical protein
MRGKKGGRNEEGERGGGRQRREEGRGKITHLTLISTPTSMLQWVQ